MMHDEGFVKGIDAGGYGSKDWIELQLNWRGHEFLDTLRDSGVWAQTKDIVAKAGGGGLQVMLNVGTALLTEIAKGLLLK
jgi:hypothetical protein